MKTPTPKSLRFIPAALGLAFCLLANHAGAALTTWDPQGSNAQNPYLGSLTATWENNNWSTSQTGQATPQAWVENTAANFAVHAGTGTPAFTVTMNANHTVAGMFDGGLTPAPSPVTIQGTGSILLPAGLQGFDFTSNTSDPGGLTINVTMKDSGVQATSCELTAEGSGNLYLNGVNTWVGGTVLGYSGSTFSGILNFNNSASFGTGGICFSNTSTSIAALVAEGSSALTIPNNITNAASSLPKIHIVAPSGGLTFSGEWDVNGQAQIGASIGPVYQTGVMKGSGGFSTLAGVSSPSSFALNGANTFTGPVTNALGTLSASSIADSGTSGIGPSSTANFAHSGGTFQYTGAGAATTARPCWLTAASTIDLPAGNLTLNGAFSSSSSANQLTKTSAGTLTLGGSTDNSSLAVAVNGGKVVLAKTSAAGVHGIGGSSSVGNGGTLQLSGNGGDQIYTSVVLTVASGGVFDLNGQTEAFATLNLSGTGSGSTGALINNNGSTTSTLTAATTLAASSSIGGTANITLASAVGGSGMSLTYVGTGTLTLSAANTYSGATAVNGGVLLVNGSTASGSAVTVASGATLGGSGTVNGTLNVGSGAILAPGVGSASAGTTLTLAGAVTLNSSCIVSNQISKTAGPTLKADKVSLSSGTLTLGGTLKVVLDTGGLALAKNDTFTLFGGTLAGSFGSISLPTPPAGVAWNSSGLTGGGNGTLVVGCDGSLSVSASGATTICNGGSATLNASASGGSGSGYTYLWSPGGATIASPSVSPTTTTPYTVTVTDSLGCTATSSSVTVTVNQKSADPASASAASPICSGQPTSLTLNGGGGGTGETIHWYTGSCGGTPVGVGNGASVSPTSTTTYYGRYEDGTPCNYNSACASVTVTVNTAPSANPVSPASQAVCPGSPATFTVSASGTGPFHYQWQKVGGGNVGTDSSSYTFNPSIGDAGSYQCVVSGACSPAGTAAAGILTVHAPPTAANSFTTNAANHTLIFDTAKLLAKATPGDSSSLSVSAAGPTSAQGPANNVVLDTGAGTITYTPKTDYTGLDSFTYTISDGNGCTVSPTITLTMGSGSGVSPNVVSSPTFDPVTGTFSVTFAGIPGVTYTVQTATSPSGPWSSSTTATAGPDGLFVVTDSELPPPPARYYRTVYP